MTDRTSWKPYSASACWSTLGPCPGFAPGNMAVGGRFPPLVAEVSSPEGEIHHPARSAEITRRHVRSRAFWCAYCTLECASLLDPGVTEGGTAIWCVDLRVMLDRCDMQRRKTLTKSRRCSLSYANSPSCGSASALTSRGGPVRSFLHFHEDAGELFVDVRLDSGFRRARVTSREEQADLLSRVRRTLHSESWLARVPLGATWDAGRCNRSEREFEPSTPRMLRREVQIAAVTGSKLESIACKAS
jgi:hypothetical protein